MTQTICIEKSILIEIKTSFSKFLNLRITTAILCIMCIMYNSNYTSTNSQTKMVFVKYLYLCFYGRPLHTQKL